MPITKEQASHLNARINARANDVRYVPSGPEPVAVVKAKALLAAWEKDQQAKRDARTARIHVAKTATQEAVLAGDWASALAAVKKFEATTF